MRLAIVDTNVVVAGLLSQEKSSPTAGILHGMMCGAFLYLLSPKLLGEYRSVCLRPKISARHGLSEEEIDVMLTEITVNAMWRDPVNLSRVPDPGDNHLWNLLETESAAVLITGDTLLLDNPPSGRQVLSPNAFVTYL
jgi:putative toxin-antitoxin system toxin component, PIN family